MLPDLALVDWRSRTEPDALPEWMDGACTPGDLGACLRDLATVNRLTLGYRPTLRFLETIVRRRRPETPGRPRALRILDVGSGGGDGLHQVARWAAKRRVAVELTGIDLQPFSAEIARERYGADGVRWVTGDVLDYRGEADVVISSLLTHHLATADVVRFLRWMEQTASVGWFVNDLERSRPAAALFSLLARALRWHRFVQHDGPVSFARSFSTADWQAMLRSAGVPAGAARVARAFPARLCVGRLQ